MLVAHQNEDRRDERLVLRDSLYTQKFLLCIQGWFATSQRNFWPFASTLSNMDNLQPAVPANILGIPEVGIGRSVVTNLPRIYGAEPLTTVYTYPSSCLNRWVQIMPDHTYSRYELYSAGLYGRHYRYCQPGTAVNPVKYSPAICPGGQTIATIKEYKTLPDVDDYSNRIWHAICCGV